MNTRRKFIKNTTLFGTGLALMPQVALGATTGENDKLHVALIGVGTRGTHHLNTLLLRKDVNIVAICDVDSERVNLALKTIEKAGVRNPKVFGNDVHDYRNLLALQEVDAVVIAAPRLWNTLMAIDAMKAGKFAGIEGGIANSISTCWDLVNTHEQTGTHMMILEHANYRRDIMAVLNMVRHDVFGASAQYSCGYQHEGNAIKFNNGTQSISGAQGNVLPYVKRNSDVYPTHGIGPIAAMADINRGNRFVSVATKVTKGIGPQHYNVKYAAGEQLNAEMNFKQGIATTTTIMTANGEPMILTHDTHLPSPYSLGFGVQGTNGLWELASNHMDIEAPSKPHQSNEADEWYAKYDHPLWKKYEHYAEGAGYGGMDFFVIHAFVEAAKQNSAPSMDVYDAAAWNAITPLAEISIRNNGAVQDFPDFTRGKWSSRPPYDWMNDV